MLSLASHVTEPPFPVSEENMMLYTWHTIKGWVAAALAFVTCPCHLPITLPLLIALTTGTALRTWLAHNAIAAAFVSTLLFIGGSS
jgi:hypothetical protein